MGDSFDGDFKKFFKNAQELSSKVESDFERCVRIATGEMIQTAKEKTPPLPGQQRGRNTVTGALADHWGSRFEKANGDNYNVYLFNNMQYASYVNDGHRMAKHFVPWLYIDSNGVIARHIPITGEQLFGLVVGTKTKYVGPYKMVESAQERFLEAFDITMSRCLDKDLKDSMEM